MAGKFRLLKADEIECRVGVISKKKTSFTLLLYKDARCDYNLLDEVVGCNNWRNHYSRDNANCTIEIWDDEKKEWVGKENVGTDSNVEQEKGRASDSFKRAGVCWGIGRELYTAPQIWISTSYCVNPEYIDGREFAVSEISYDANEKIKSLKIKNIKTGNVVWEFPEKKGRTEKKAEKDFQKRLETIPTTITADMWKALQTTATSKGEDINDICKRLKIDVNKPSSMKIEVWKAEMDRLNG